MERALVVLNPHARRGAGIRTYERVRADLEVRFRVRHAVLDGTERWRHAIDAARRDGIERILAVGGDGTVHAVGNAILEGGAWTGVALGAIAAGSSNDFHKPCETRVRGVPARLGGPIARDVGLATFEDAAGMTLRRWFFVSASIGFCARANRRFRGPSLGSVDAAVAYAAAGTLVHHENLRARVDERDVALSNLAVMLTPYLAGAFRFESTRHAGTFAVHLLEGRGRLGVLRTMAQLLAGRVARSTARSVRVALDREDDLELDGELFRASRVRFDVVPRALAVCS